MSCPSAIGDRSTSIGAPAAMVEASGFIWETSGQTTTAPPTAATAPVATKRKSRRVAGCAEEEEDTFANPFRTATARRTLGLRRRARRKRQSVPAGLAGAELTCSTQPGRTGDLESIYWHPCRLRASPVSAPAHALRKFSAWQRFLPPHSAPHRPCGS